MPIYEYACADCHTEFEKLVRSTTSAVEIRCPNCGGTDVKKGWSLFGVSKAGSAPQGIAAPSNASCGPAST